MAVGKRHVVALAAVDAAAIDAATARARDVVEAQVGHHLQRQQRQRLLWRAERRS